MNTEIYKYLFESLNQKNIPYCVLRNYQRLPYENIGSDIDISIERGFEKDIENIIDIMCQNFKLTIIKKTRRQLLYQYFIIDNDSKVLQLDFHDVGEQYRGVNYLKSEELISRRRLYNGIYVVNEIDEAIVSLLSSLLWGGFIKEKYIKNIYNTFTSNSDEVNKILRKAFSDKISNNIINFIKEEKYDNLKLNVKQYRKEIILKGIFKNPLKTINNNINYFYNEFKFRYFNSGMFIVFLGCDGSGKSTIIENMRSLLCNLFNNKEIHYYHWRPNRLKQLRKIGKNTSQEKQVLVVDDPHKKDPHNILISNLRFIYYTLDYIISYPKFIKAKAKNGIILFDRYYYDMIIDDRRYRMKNINILYKLMSIFIPKPDLVIYLDSTPEELIYRKAELSYEGYKKALNNYREFIKNNKNMHLINTNNGIEYTGNQVQNIIINYLTQRDYK